LLVALHLDDGEPMPLTRDGLPRRAAAASSRCRPEPRWSSPSSPPRDRQRPRSSPPSISRAVAAATF